jgi:hypothetical protein
MSGFLFCKNLEKAEHLAGTDKLLQRCNSAFRLFSFRAEASVQRLCLSHHHDLAMANLLIFILPGARPAPEPRQRQSDQF